MKLADDWPEGPVGCLDDIEILKEHDAITGNVKYPASRSLASRGRNQRARARSFDAGESSRAAGRLRDRARRP